MLNVLFCLFSFTTEVWMNRLFGIMVCSADWLAGWRITVTSTSLCEEVQFLPAVKIRGSSFAKSR